MSNKFNALNSPRYAEELQGSMYPERGTRVDLPRLETTVDRILQEEANDISALGRKLELAKAYEAQLQTALQTIQGVQRIVEIGNGVDDTFPVSLDVPHGSALILSLLTGGNVSPMDSIAISEVRETDGDKFRTVFRHYEMPARYMGILEIELAPGIFLEADYGEDPEGQTDPSTLRIIKKEVRVQEASDYGSKTGGAIDTPQNSERIKHYEKITGKERAIQIRQNPADFIRQNRQYTGAERALLFYYSFSDEQMEDIYRAWYDRALEERPRSTETQVLDALSSWLTLIEGPEMDRWNELIQRHRDALVRS